MKKVLIGMSGGIDSAVAAYLLKKKNYNVIGVTMSLWKSDYTVVENSNSCFGSSNGEGIKKASEICKKLGIKHVVLDLSDEYEKIVLENFKTEYLNGRTPNPCVWCNQKIKFGFLLDQAREKGLQFDYFATGHYARIKRYKNRYALLRAKDLQKDQSYFLYRLSQKQLSQILFPLGNFTKKRIKELDVRLGFHSENQTESQDFYSGSYTDLLNVKPKEGNIVDLNGNILGKHKGIWNYTIGQRRGLRISSDKPLYVVSLNPDKNEITVGPEKKTKNFVVTANLANWVSSEPIDRPVKVTAKIRSTGLPVPCILSLIKTSENTKNGNIENKDNETDRLKVEFSTPVKAATCGQSLVVYKNNRVLCGGIIDSTQ